MSRSNATARRAGYDAEADLVRFLRDNGAPHAERRVAGSATDRGDVAGVPGVVFEAKNPGGTTGAVSLGPWLDETLRERDHDHAAVGMLVIRRRLKVSPGNWFWVTDGDTMTALLRGAGWLA